VRNVTGVQTCALPIFSKASGMTFMLNRIAGDNLDKSFTLYEAADQAEPEFNDDGNWVWSYSRSADGKNYAIKLKASRISGQDVNWNLYVSNPEEIGRASCREGVSVEVGGVGWM